MTKETSSPNLNEISEAKEKNAFEVFDEDQIKDE